MKGETEEEEKGNRKEWRGQNSEGEGLGSNGNSKYRLY